MAAGAVRATMRAIRDDEFPAAASLFYDALADLTARRGMEAPHRDVDLVARGYRYVARSGIFRVAVVEGRLAAIACAIVRGPQWFLAGFWADPALRLRGIGGPLLREVRDEGERSGARVFYVWSSPDEAAIASYLKLGMLPGTQLFTFIGPLDAPPAPPAFATEPLTPERVSDLDRTLVGVRRDGDHGYWLDRAGARGRVVRRGDEVVGYYHVHDGVIGPAGWTRDDAGHGVLAAAFADAATDGKALQLSIPGMNHTALRFALASGLRLIRQSHLLWSAPVGDMARYVPSGPLLF